MSHPSLRLHLLSLFLILVSACGPAAQPVTVTPDFGRAGRYSAAHSSRPAYPAPIQMATGYPAPMPTAPRPPLGYAPPATAQAPRVIQCFVSASTIGTLRPEIVVQFSRSMDRASVAAALSLTPGVIVDLQWDADFKELRLSPREPLTPDTSYQLTVAANARDQAGAPLEQPYRWTHYARPLVAATHFPGWSDRQSPITIDFNYAMQRRGVEAAFRIEPAVEGALQWTADGMRLTFTPVTSPPHDTTYTISFTGPLSDASGDRAPAPGPFTFTTPPPILALSPEPDASVSPAASIRITFDRPMDHAATEAALTLEPATPGHVTWDETTLVFQPEAGNLNENTRYTVTVGAAARAADGEALFQEPFRWSFSTTHFAQFASFGIGPNAQVLDTAGRRAVQFVFVSEAEYSRLNFALYQLTLEQFLDRYSSGFRGVLGFEARGRFDTADLPRVQTWGVGGAAPMPNALDAWTAETFIPPDVPPGAYVLDLMTDTVQDQLIVLLSRHTLVVKQAEGQLVAWATDVNGAPAPGVEVGVYARNGQLLSAGQTDGDGVFRVEVTRDPQPLIVVARVGGDLTAAGLSNEWRSSTGYWEDWWRPTPQAADYALYIYTDRPIYRPGQTMYFKAIVRRDADAAYSVPPAGTTVTARLRDARDNVVRTVYLYTNEFGTVSSLFRLAEGAMLGEYAVELTVDGENHRQAFKVQDYRKPDYDVTVKTDGASYVSGETIRVTVDSRYFFGEPVPGATVRLKQYELGQEYCWETCPGDDVWYPLFDRQEITGRTDAQGRVTFTLNAALGNLGQQEAWWSSVQHSRIGIEATVDDGSRQAVSGFAVADVFSADARLRLDTGGYLKTPGQPFTVQTAARSILDEPLDGQALELQLRRWNYGASDYATVVQAWEARTGADGRAGLSIAVAEPGFYQLRLAGNDRHGREVTADGWLYVFSDAAFYGAQADTDLRLAADRDTYAPGDTANLLIESSFSGPALLTFERGTVRREQLVALTAPFTRVPVMIQPDDAPNIVVGVSAWQALTDTLQSDQNFSLSDSRLRTARVNLSVPALDKQLTVTLTPDKAEYAPRQAATFRVRVTDVEGQPVVAEVSLALVDEAIFRLSDELSGPIFDAFYHERDSLVRSFDSLALQRWLSLYDGGRGGGGGGPSVGNPRSDFPDTAIWKPNLVTDANGEATLTLDLPDTLTSWRLTAKAVTVNHEVGEAFVNVTTHQALVVRPLLPRTLTAGDAFELSAIVHNYSGGPRDVVVGLQTGGLLQLDSPVTQTLPLDAGEQRIVGWAATAWKAGDSRITIYAEADDLSDAVQLPLTVQPLAIPDVTTQVGELTGKLNTSLPLPADALGLSTVRIELSRSIAGNLLTGLEYLTGFPYGCVEQTMSKALPNAVVGRALKQLGLGNPTLQADLPPKINASLQRLYGFQHNDGGWGWWYDDDDDAYQTAWVVFGLSVTAQAGYEVDSGVIRRGAEWLTANLKNMDERTRAFALYSLSAAGYGDLAATRALARHSDGLDTFSRAGLALALNTLGARDEARAIVDRLAQAAVQKEGLAYWPDAQEDGHYRAKTMSSTTRSTALALSALVTVAPDHALVSDVVRYLMSQRQAAGWGSTNETSFTLLALTDTLLAREEDTADTLYTVALNGQIIAEGRLGRGEPAAIVEVAASQMAVGDNALRVTQSGGGRLYYVISQRVYRPLTSIESAGGLRVVRAYLDPESGQAITGAVAAGQLVKVVLSVEMPRLGAYMIVEDRLPGGLEALNEALNMTSHDAVPSENCYTDGSGCEVFAWQGYGYNNKEVRGDRVSFFITELGAGRATFSYLARATRSGEFVAMPAEAYAMYDPTLWGRSASDEVTIAK